MKKNNSLALVFLALVAVIAVVGLILIGTKSLSGRAVEEVTGLAGMCGGTNLGSCPPNYQCRQVSQQCVSRGFRGCTRYAPVYNCMPLPPKPTPTQKKCGVDSFRVEGEALYSRASWKCYNKPAVTRAGPSQPSQAWQSLANNECRSRC